MCSPFSTDDSRDGENASPLKTVSGGMEAVVLGESRAWVKRAMRSASVI